MKKIGAGIKGQYLSSKSEDKIIDIEVDSIGLSSRAPGGFRTVTNLFCSFLPKYGINSCVFGYTKGKPKGDGKYVPILTHLFPRLYLIYLALFFVAPFLAIRKKSVIMTNRTPDQLPFIIFYPWHPKVCRMTGSTEMLRINNSRLIFHLYNFLERICVPFIDRFIVLDQTSREYIERKYRLPETKISVIPVMVDLNTFKVLDKHEARKTMGFTQDGEIILYVGRLMKVKNIELLLNSFKEIKKVRKNVLLVLAGTGPHEVKLKELAQQLNIEGVKFLGYVEPANMPMLMNCADVFALSSLTESGPRVSKEAIACGVPVVSTSVGDSSQYITNEENGFIVKTEIASFTNGLLRALENKELLRKGAIRSREKLSVEKEMKMYAEVFRSVYTQHRSRRIKEEGEKQESIAR